MAYLQTVASSNLGYQNFFSGKLTSPVSATDTDIFIDTIPSITEGVLVIDWDVAASREVIFFNSKTASKVVCPSVANGRGFDGSTATTHLSGANVIMAPVADYFRYIQYIATTSTAAWKPLGYTPSTIVDNGNRSFTMVFNSVDLTSFVSPGMRLKGTPTTAKPTQCALLNGTTQYANKTTPAGMAWTDDFASGAWIKPSSYTSGSIISRFNNTSGWQLYMLSTGQIYFVGYNASSSNYSQVGSYQSVPLNKWVHVAGQLDMSTFTATTTTSYIMFDGKDVPAQVSRAGTNPTALIQAGDLQVGAYNGATLPFPGKIAQAFVTSVKLTQANVNLIKNQGITASDCTTYSIASAFSLSGASGLTDINTTNANNLTAQGSLTTTNADSPFGVDGFGVPGTNEFGLVMSATFSTNTTVVVQAPEGCTWPTLPTSSAISAMYYSTEQTPYGWVGDKGRWTLKTLIFTGNTQGSPVSGTWYNIASQQISIPVGQWSASYSCPVYGSITATGVAVHATLSTGAATESDIESSTINQIGGASGAMLNLVSLYKARDLSLTAQTTYYLNEKTSTSAVTTLGLAGDVGRGYIYAQPSNL